MSNESLTYWVLLAQVGDSEAISQLFHLFRNDVYSIALRETKNRTLAEDIVQETFVEVICTIDNLKAPEAFPAWLKQIAYHQCTRHFKRKETRHEVLAAESEESLSVFDTLEEKNTSYLPDEALDQKEFRAIILKLMAELPEVQSSALRMFYFDELSLKAIAEVQGVSVNTANTRLNRGRKAMQSTVESYEKKHGIRLHTIVFFPFFKWLLADTQLAMPAEAASNVAASLSSQFGITIASTKSGAATGADAAVSATTGTGSATASSATAGAAGLGAKILAAPMGTKVIAGILAASVAVGGATVGYQASKNKETRPGISVSQEQREGTNITATDPTLANVIETVSATESNPLAVAYAEYEAMLQSGVTQNGFVPAYYAYVDIDQDGIPELLMADSDGTPDSWTTCEMYTYQDGQVVYCGHHDARYTYFYHVNGSHLLGTNRMGAWYLSPNENFRTVYGGEYSIIYGDGREEVITEDKFDYYNSFSLDTNSNLIPGGFATSAEIVQLQRNTFLNNILADTLDFSKVWTIHYHTGNYKLVLNYLFEPEGKVYCAIGIEYSDIIAFYTGTYTAINDIVSFTMDTGENIWEYTYSFDPDRLEFTQISETSPFNEHEKGSVMQLVDEDWISVDSIKRLVEYGLPNDDQMAP